MTTKGGICGVYLDETVLQQHDDILEAIRESLHPREMTGDEYIQFKAELGVLLINNMKKIKSFLKDKDIKVYGSANIDDLLQA